MSSPQQLGLFRERTINAAMTSGGSPALHPDMNGWKSTGPATPLM
jgi:hypothetical protein